MTLTEPIMPRRRQLDAVVPRSYQISMRNDFLTPRGTPYKWQEVTAAISRTVTGTAARTVVPVTYEWQHVSSRTGTSSRSGKPDSSTESREWGFARGQSFRSVLLHTEVVQNEVPSEPPR
jgi:hypothetical protein